MKKKLLVFACVALLVCACTFAVGAADGESEKLWDFWGLLNAGNVDYIGVAVMLLTSLFTVFRMFNGTDGLKSLMNMLLTALKNLIPSGK